MMRNSVYGFGQFANEPNVRLDPARLTGSNHKRHRFFGAGTILHNGNKISGLTTEASLWAIAALGISNGAGIYFGTMLTII
ncbi:MgtC/SapB family protein [Paenibacillus sp. RC67]|uniref:MgtC/SapB family protein n=1 Tax=Paenibacillus sp. RC67 TaxID=3039392 RepID=UPI0024ADC907|nr:MgtC/SapB family protein [Paenibacillus sp. RC67]